MELNLQRRAQLGCQKIHRFRRQNGFNVKPFGFSRARAEQPTNIFTLTTGDPVQDIGPIADFFHGGASQVIAQFRVAGKNDGKAAVATLHQFHQALEAGQCMPVEIMRFIDEQRDRSLVLFFFTSSHRSRSRFSPCVGIRTCRSVERS